jgi:unsaturated rhamnogalacturonyl hydrolase
VNLATRFIAAFVLVLVSQTALAGTWGDWPQGTDPKDVGKRIATNLVDRKEYMVKTGGIQYPEICTAYGSLRFADAIGDQALLDKLIDRYKPLVSDKPETPDGKTLLMRAGQNVDASVFGTVPLEIFILTHDDKFLTLGLKYADAQWEKPAQKDPPTTQMTNFEQGLTPQTRFWIDDMFMITSLQVQAYRATKDKKYLDRGAHEMVAYLDKLQQPNGLFYHGEGANFYWGRGDGWVAAGMTELLLTMPEDHPDRPRIVEGYKKMMAALLKNQDEKGMWHQLIDDPSSWPETSCTGMFTFAIGTGVKKGWLDSAQYKNCAKKGWTALTGYIDENANVREVCEGTNKKFDKEYYLNRKRNTGDLHGQAATIWAAWAMLD